MKKAIASPDLVACEPMEDLVNGSFELLGALLAWRNALQLWRDREIKGVYWPVYVFYSGWGVWNLWYYTALGQPFSFWAGALLCAGNLAWVAFALHWRYGASHDQP